MSIQVPCHGGIVVIFVKTMYIKTIIALGFSTLYDVTASRAISARAKILQPSLECCHGHEHCILRFLVQMEKIQKDRQHSPVLVWLSLSFQDMRVFKSNWIWKIKYFRVFFFVSLYVALWSIETLLISITSASHRFHFQPSEQTIFLSQSSRLGHGTRPQRQSIGFAPDQTTTTDNHMCLRSSHRSDHAPTLTSDYCQTRPPDQISPQTTIHGCSTSNKHSTPNLVKWYRSGALFVGWVKGGI